MTSFMTRLLSSDDNSVLRRSALTQHPAREKSRANFPERQASHTGSEMSSLDKCKTYVRLDLHRQRRNKTTSEQNTREIYVPVFRRHFVGYLSPHVATCDVARRLALSCVVLRCVAM